MHGGLRAGTGRQCHRPDELHRRRGSADQHTDTGRSPSAAPMGESHTPETPGRITISIALVLNRTKKDDKLESNLLLQCRSGHVWKNLHSDTTG